jgi:hypothetical protein
VNRNDKLLVSVYALHGDTRAHATLQSLGCARRSDPRTVLSADSPSARQSIVCSAVALNYARLISRIVPLSHIPRLLAEDCRVQLELQRYRQPL